MKTKKRSCAQIVLKMHAKTRFHEYAVFRVAHVGTSSNTNKIIAYSRGLLKDKSNVVKMNMHIYLVESYTIFMA